MRDIWDNKAATIRLRMGATELHAETHEREIAAALREAFEAGQDSLLPVFEKIDGIHGSVWADAVRKHGADAVRSDVDRMKDKMRAHANRKREK